jgi:hypothetical protein
MNRVLQFRVVLFDFLSSGAFLLDFPLQSDLSLRDQALYDGARHEGWLCRGYCLIRRGRRRRRRTRRR